MALILSIETSTPVCSVALFDKEKILGAQTLYIDKSHSGLLAPIIESLVGYCGYSLKDLNAVAVSEGPGSYTGLRIGVSAAKGICYALDIPLIGVSTLKAMAHGANKYNHGANWLCPMLDARRMEVYTSLYDSDLRTIIPVKPVVLSDDSFSVQLSDKKITFFGNGAAKASTVIVNDNASFIQVDEMNAENIGALAYEKFVEAEFEDVAYFEPFYLKEFRVTQPKAK